ncbi:MAG TPA: DUF6582 domain-containing protein [Candidatus Paceibacterota bacterium]|nr:DUF6582 domain-containing protein [Candidatus Paceibacterota bacterium]
MGKLSAKQRNALPSSEFAEPGQRKYPLNNPAHARNALARASQHASPELRAKIKAKVRARYPNIAVEGEKGKPSAHRKERK